MNFFKKILKKNAILTSLKKFNLKDTANVHFTAEENTHFVRKG